MVTRNCRALTSLIIGPVSQLRTLNVEQTDIEELNLSRLAPQGTPCFFCQLTHVWKRSCSAAALNRFCSGHISFECSLAAAFVWQLAQSGLADCAPELVAAQSQLANVERADDGCAEQQRVVRRGHESQRLVSSTGHLAQRGSFVCVDARAHVAQFSGSVPAWVQSVMSGGTCVVQQTLDSNCFQSLASCSGTRCECEPCVLPTPAPTPRPTPSVCRCAFADCFLTTRCCATANSTAHTRPDHCCGGAFHVDHCLALEAAGNHAVPLRLSQPRRFGARRLFCTRRFQQSALIVACLFCF